jgi:tRNA threonylcarbamoyladenosine biosynthesis protein TsaE
VGGHVVHAAVETRCQPGLQARFGVGEVDRRDTDLGESELTRPLPELLRQSLSIEVMPIGQAEIHAPILGSRSFSWPDEAACAATAGELARRPGLARACIELHGPLGAGKTTFARHLLRALGVQGRVKSPTYAVLEPYELPGLSISHFDFYRFSNAREWEDAGFRELFAAPGLKLVEWPEHAAALLPPADLRLFITPGEGQARTVRAEAGSAAGLDLLP